MAGIGGITNLLFKRTSAFALTTIVAAFIFERSFDASTEYFYDQLNKGKQWKEIKHRYTE